MTTIYGTLGFTPDKFLPTLRQRSDVEAACCFHDDHPDSVEAAREVARYCKDLGVDYASVQVDAFDLVDAAGAMQAEVRDRGPEAADLVFNVTGGTKVLSAAAILVCILEGLRAVYVHEETGREVPLPLLTVRYDRVLTEAERRVLRFIAEHEGEGPDPPGTTQADIRAGLELSKPTVSHHVGKLVDHGVVEEAPDPDDGRRKLLTVIPSARLLLGEPA